MEDRSISDIISSLKSASESIWRDAQAAQLALIRREQRLEIENMEMEGKYDGALKEKRILKKQYDELARENGELEEKLRVCGEELDGLREKIARLEEERARERSENVGGLLDRIRCLEEENSSICGRAETAERRVREGREETVRLLEKIRCLEEEKEKSERGEREVGGETARHLPENVSLEKDKRRGFDEAENYKKVCIRLKEQFHNSNDNLNSSNAQARSRQAFDDKGNMQMSSEFLGSCPGEVLTRQPYHRSEDVWSDLEYTHRPLRTRERTGILKDWKVTDEMLAHVRIAGFHCLHRIGHAERQRVKVDPALMTALVERWRPETHTFHLLVGEATVTLQDVAVIMGLRVDGTAVTGSTSYNWADIVEQSLGVRPDVGALKGCSLRISWLREHFANIPNDADDLTILRYSRAYILALMGGLLFADCSGSDVQLHYLPLLADLKAAGQYSWGSAVLAYLYRQLCRASEKAKTDIGGPLLLLQIWAWERISFGRPKCEYPVDQHHREAVPPPFSQHFQAGRDSLAYRWIEVPHRFVHTARNLGYYRDRLDRQLEDQFEWEPYTAYVMAGVAPICRDAATLWRAKVPLICFDIVEWHRPNRVLRQFGLAQQIPDDCDYDETLHHTDRRGRATLDWAVEHADHVLEWDDRWNCIEVGQTTYPQAAQHYMAWYRQITRLLVSPTSAQSLSHYHPTASSTVIMIQLLRGMADRSRVHKDTIPPSPEYIKFRKYADDMLSRVEGLISQISQMQLALGPSSPVASSFPAPDQLGSSMVVV